MNENPQKENGYTAIANEIVEALAHTKLNTQESRVLWTILRKTYGFNKSEDWVSLSQIKEMTGLSITHASRAKARLIERKILAQTGNKVRVNKFYSHWRGLPKQASVKTNNKGCLNRQVGVASSGNQGLPKQADTKVDVTKVDITKDSPKRKKSDNEIQTTFRELVFENQWCDDVYADKTIKQIQKLSKDDRVECHRKMSVMIGMCRSSGETVRKCSERLFHEIAGFVNDKQFKNK